MITIISPDAFKKIPWKNGLGFTTELAINDGANLENFDWRLSIASVTSNGEFSNFSGYDRNLVLIEGHSISLQHDEKNTDKLTQLLDIAKFDGGCKTFGTLHQGAINDFNIITKQITTAVHVETYTKQQDVIQKLSKRSLMFVYSLSANVTINHDGKVITLSQGSLAKIEISNDDSKNLTISGKDMIIINVTLL
jgi:environmental stress-induced protein Ves